MKVTVLGAGVIGTTSAYYLRQQGHEVVVYDRRTGPGLETSFANAGQVSWGYAAPWAAPGIPLKALRWMAAWHPPLIIRPRLDLAMLRWLWAMLRNCSAGRYEANKTRLVRFARYSRECLAALRQDTGIAYDDQQRGTLQLFRDQAALDRAARDSAVLDGLGVPNRILDRAGCLAIEPGLRHCSVPIAGGLHLPGDETGDCFKFTAQLAALAQQQGVAFRMGKPIETLLVEGARVAGAVIDGQLERADAYLVAMGSHSPTLLRHIGIRIPVYPVKGYSATLSVHDPAAAPTSTVMDETHKVAITRLGNRIRAGGIAELTGYDLAIRSPPCRTLRRVVEELFPQGEGFAEISYWAGLRAMTPDGAPIIGATPYSNLFLNTGHGTLGWTMACGSGRVIADLISRGTADVEAPSLSRDAGDRPSWSAPPPVRNPSR
jgi:D-amino-acid dehydrogenase